MKKLTLIVTVLLFSTLSLFAQAKGDPWIKKYYNDTYRREPTALEYNIKNYNNGSWNSYADLSKYIGEYQKNISAAGLTFRFSTKTYANNSLIVGVFQNGTQLAASLISQDGGGVIAAGGGNIISGGAGNVVAAGGGNVVASGGGNIVVNSNTKGANFGGSYTLASEGTKVIKTSGSGAMIIK